jgi:phage-related minor tail protein
MPLRAAELEVLFTADTKQIDKADKDVKSIGQRIEKTPIKATITADEKGALAGMDRVERAAKKIVSADTAIKLDADISRAEKGLERAKQRLADLEVRALGGLDVTADTRRAEAQLQKTERQLKALTSAKAMIEVDADSTPAQNEFRKAKGAAGEAGDDVGDQFGVNVVAALATIPVAGAVIGVGKAAADALLGAFQEGLQQGADRDRLQALTGIDEASAARLALAAGEAYANVFGESIESNMDTARLALQFDLVDADATTAQSQRVIQSLAGIADVLGEDVRPVAASVATLLRTGVAKSADEAFDILATGAREGVNRMEDLLDTFTEYPALFAQLGLDGAEALGLINQGLEGGARNSDLVADALKELQIRAIDAAGTYNEGFELLGLNADQMQDRFAAGGDSAREALREVLNELNSLEDPLVRNAAATTLFGTQAEDLGAALFALDLDTAVDGLNGVQGAAQRMFDTLSSNDATRIEQAERNIEVAADGIKGALAAAFSEPLGELATFVSENRGPVTQFLLDLVNGAIDFGRSVVESTAVSTEAFGQFVAGPLRDTAMVLRDIIEALPGDTDLSGLDHAIEQMAGFDEQANAAAETIRDTAIPVIDDMQSRLNAWADPVLAMGYLNDATLRLAGALGEVGVAADGTMLSVEGLDTSNLGATESGALLEGQIRRAVGALGEEISAAAAAGEGQDALAARYAASREALLLQLEAMGLTRDQAIALTDAILATPGAATTTFSSNAAAQETGVDSLANTIVTLPDGSVVVVANTAPADAAINELVSRSERRQIRIQATAVGAAVVSEQAQGGVLEYFARGGFHSGRGLTPMAPIAQMVPANTWRVVGDRADVAEAYIPLDNSPRSRAILAEVMRRMGIVPMADGGVTRDGAVRMRRGDQIIHLYPPPGLDPRFIARELRDLQDDETAGEVP